MNKEEFFRCACGSIAHQMVVSVIDDPDEPEVVVEIYLNPELGFFHRLWNAVRYTFGSRLSNFGSFTEVILRKKDADRLQSVVDSVRKYGAD